MKTLLTLLLSTSLTGAVLAGSFGSGPWSDGAYYPGYLNGKYMGVVTGNNISGILGFAIVDGAPPFRTTEEQTTSGGEFAPIPIVNQSISPDVLQNYFAIFVEGRTYTGITYAGIDIASKTVAGALQGQNPVGLLPAGDDGTINFDATDALSIVDRGLSGGFTAKVKEKKAVFTFSGDGQLSTPANTQKVTITAVPEAIGGIGPVPPGTITNEVITGKIETHSTSFHVKGIRTSQFSSNPSAQRDAIELSAGGGGAQ